MASGITKKQSLNVKNAIVDIKDGKILLEIEDNPIPYDLAELMQEFNGALVNISVGISVDIE